MKKVWHDWSGEGIPPPFQRPAIKVVGVEFEGGLRIEDGRKNFEAMAWDVSRHPACPRIVRFAVRG
jgi:hypothetical protein